MSEMVFKALLGLGSEVALQLIRAVQGKPVSTDGLRKKTDKVQSVANKWRARQ